MKISAHPPYGRITRLALASFAVLACAFASFAENNGDGSVSVGGELKQWHAVTLDLAGPFAREADTGTRTFLDYNFSVSFTHESGIPSYTVPGYFAADGDAANRSADSGTVWRAHLSPDKAGMWHYRTHFSMGKNVAVDPSEGKELSPYDAVDGRFKVAASSESAPDFRARGRLQYVNQRYLRFAGDGAYFFKVGSDAPETMLAYTDFDNTISILLY